MEKFPFAANSYFLATYNRYGKELQVIHLVWMK